MLANNLHDRSTLRQVPFQPLRMKPLSPPTGHSDGAWADSVHAP